MIVNQNKLDRLVYKLAKEYILSIDKITPEILDIYLCPPEKKPQSLADIYEHLLNTAKNRNMSENVISKAIGGIGKLKDILCSFSPSAVVAKYCDSWKRLLNDTVRELNLQVRTTPRSLWPQFCKTATSGAGFLAGFPNVREFYQWIEFFNRDERVRPALPMILSYEIKGFGFPLACDFIKELGYLRFGKPDVHLKKIFTALELSMTGNNYEVFKAIVRISNSVGVTAYNVDKLFWLIGSGNFYKHKKLKVGRHRDKFIQYAKEKLAYT